MKKIRKRQSSTAEVPGPIPGWRKHARNLLVLWALLFGAYSNSFRAGVIFDNFPILTEDPRIRLVSPANLHAIFTGPYWFLFPARGLYRPLTTLSYMVNYAVLGNASRPEGYHAINLALHAANAGLAYGLALFVLEDATLALAMAALWGLHPLLTESVTNIVGRADLLSALGVLAGLLCFLHGASAEGRRRWAWLGGLVIAQTLGLFSKESAAVLPALMLLADLVWPRRADRRWRILAYVSLILPFAAFFCMRAAAHAHMVVDAAENPLLDANFWAARLTAARIVATYGWLFLWPASLSADYSAIPLFGSGGFWESTKAVMGVLVCGGALLLAFRYRRKFGKLFFFVLFFFVSLSPTSNVFMLIGSIMAERFAYLPSIGLAGCVVWAIAGLAKNQRKTILVSACAISLALAARTYARNQDWSDGLSLWTRTVRVCPNSARAHYELGVALAMLPGEREEAISQFRRAIEIKPDMPWAHMNLAIALAQSPERVPEALAEYKRALETKPDYAEAHYNLGVTLSKIPGRLPEAISEFNTALAIKPDYVDAHLNLGAALARTPGGLPDAAAEYQETLRIAPESFEAHMSLGITLAQMPGQLSAAISEFRAGVTLRPEDAGAHYFLGLALSKLPDRLAQAVSEYETALRLNPNDLNTQTHLKVALSQLDSDQREAVFLSGGN